MPKPIILTGIVGAVVVVGGIGYFVSQQPANPSAINTVNQTTTSSSTSGEIKINDPDGQFKYFSDPSITKQPEPNFVYGNGQTLSVDYDGSKSEEGASLFFNLYYVSSNGNVIEITSDTFEGKTKGTFTNSNKVFTSSADGRPGFVEVTVVQNSHLNDDNTISGKNVTLGMYPIKIETSKD